MSTDVQWDGGFSGKKRQGMIHRELFGLLVFGEGGYLNNDESVFDWLTDDIGWSNLSEKEKIIFASLVKALPDSHFNYDTGFVYEGGGLDEMYHSITYLNGTLSLSSSHRYEVSGGDVGDENAEDWDDDYGCRVGEDSVSLTCDVDKDGFIINDDSLSQECLKFEKEELSDLLELVKTGTDDLYDLLDLGMVYEAGLAGIDRNLTLAWDYYLKAVGTGDEDAVTFVREIFSAESKDDLRELLTSKSISRESYPLFFELAQQENNAELTAELRKYKTSLE